MCVWSTSDNIKGIKGIGPKKSKQLIDRVLSGNMNEKDSLLLTENRELIALNKSLIDMNQLPIEFIRECIQEYKKSVETQKNLASEQFFDLLEEKYKIKNLYVWFESIKSNIIDLEMEEPEWSKKI